MDRQDHAPSADPEIAAVAAAIRTLDPTGERVRRVLRDTLDQLYDGQRTGRYRWDQLHKTEKTHCGTLVEINLHREFQFLDGATLDYCVVGVEVDCKYSQTLGGWMIPPEALDHLCLLVWADDAASHWSMGLVRVTLARLNSGGNRDRKATFNQLGREAIVWLFQQTPLPPNALLQLPREVVDEIMALPSGAQRVNELFRRALGMRISRTVVATAGQQKDPMKRVRYNGGARSQLRGEGIIILGQYHAHIAVARDLGVAVPGYGESVSVRVSPTAEAGPRIAAIDGGFWRVAEAGDPIVPAPLLAEI